jgi:hypothetical protein
MLPLVISTHVTDLHVHASYGDDMGNEQEG